jgi:hypothetical protein
MEWGAVKLVLDAYIGALCGMILSTVTSTTHHEARQRLANAAVALAGGITDLIVTWWIKQRDETGMCCMVVHGGGLYPFLAES